MEWNKNLTPKANTSWNLQQTSNSTRININKLRKNSIISSPHKNNGAKQNFNQTI